MALCYTLHLSLATVLRRKFPFLTAPVNHYPIFRPPACTNPWTSLHLVCLQKRCCLTTPTLPCGVDGTPLCGTNITPGNYHTTRPISHAMYFAHASALAFMVIPTILPQRLGTIGYLCILSILPIDSDNYGDHCPASSPSTTDLSDPFEPPRQPSPTPLSDYSYTYFHHRPPTLQSLANRLGPARYLGQYGHT